MKSFFFYETDSGALEGKWTLTRDQTQEENCTLHNYNVVPTKHDDILVHGSYQSGIGVLDFSNRANAREIAFADPAPLPLTSTGGTQDGGDWSSYFYNGIIYETDITRGLFTWRLDDRDTERAMEAGLEALAARRAGRAAQTRIRCGRRSGARPRRRARRAGAPSGAASRRSPRGSPRRGGSRSRRARARSGSATGAAAPRRGTRSAPRTGPPRARRRAGARCRG